MITPLAEVQRILAAPAGARWSWQRWQEYGRLLRAWWQACAEVQTIWRES